LSSSEISERQQQINQFVKRTTRESRKVPPSAGAEGQAYVSDFNGGTARVVEKFGSSPSINPSFGTISSEKEYLGDGKYLTREVVLDEFSVLSGQNYDDTFDVAIPFTREIVEAGELAADESAEIEPRNSLHSVKTLIDKQAVIEVLDQYHVQAGDIQSVNLPSVLKEITCNILNEEAKTDFNDGNGNSASAGGSVEIQSKAILNYKISAGYNGPAEAVRHIFFLPEEDCGYEKILGKTGAEKWPIIRPREERVEVTTVSERKSLTIQKSLPNNTGRSGSASKTSSTSSVSIPPTLHASIPINTSDVSGPTSSTITISVTAPSGTVTNTLTAIATTQEFQGSVPATTPESFPAGDFLYNVSISPYRYGYVRVDAIVVKVTEDMVALN
jgi:hypothetical protein